MAVNDSPILPVHLGGTDPQTYAHEVVEGDFGVEVEEELSMVVDIRALDDAHCIQHLL